MHALLALGFFIINCRFPNLTIITRIFLQSLYLRDDFNMPKLDNSNSYGQTDVQTYPSCRKHLLLKIKLANDFSYRIDYPYNKVKGCLSVCTEGYR